MRIGSLLFVLGFAGAVCSARADVIFSGSVMGQSTGASCSASGVAYGSLSIGCSTSDSLAIGTMQGSGNAYSGSLDVTAMQNTGIGGVGARVTTDGEVDLNQTYVLAGGVGLATVNFILSTPNGGSLYFPGVWSCLFTFDGVAQSCANDAYPEVTFSEQVFYGVPFTIGFDLTMDAFAESGSGTGQAGIADYSFNEPGLFATPEPASVLLVLSGLVGIGFAAWRARRRMFS